MKIGKSINSIILTTFISSFFLLTLFCTAILSEPTDFTIQLYKGFNLINYPGRSDPVLTAFEFIQMLGNSNEIESVQKLDGSTGKYKSVKYDTSGEPVGEDFIISNGEGYIVYSYVRKSVTLPFERKCFAIDLVQGINLVGTSCIPPDITAFDMLYSVGDETEVSSIQRFDPGTGKFETVGYLHGQFAGINFPLRTEEGFFIFMKQNKKFCPMMPSVLIIYPNEGQVLKGQVEINAEVMNSDEITTVEIYIDGSPLATLYTAPYVFIWDTGVFPDGNHTIRVTAKDLCGNIATDEIGVVLDNFFPNIKITSPVDTSTVFSSPITVSGTIDDASAQVTVNGINASVTGNTFTANGVPLVEGQNMITAIAIDQFGNPAADSVTVTLCTICIIKPVVNDDGVYTTSPVELHATWTFIDPGINIIEYQYAIGTSGGSTDVVDWTSAGIQTEITHTGLSLIQGQTYYISVRGMDTFGLWSDVGTSDGIKIDQHIPAIIDIQPADGSTGYAQESINFSVNAQDGDGDVLSYQFSLDGQVIQAWQSTPDFLWSTTDADLGVHTIKIEVSDNNGGEVSQNIGICLFRRPPAPPSP